MKKTFVISLIFIVCGILGFVCQLLYAYFFGLGKEMDIYFSFLSIPAIITGASGAVFSSLFFPIFARIDSVELDSYIWTIKECVSKIALLIAVVGFVITYFNMDYIVGSIEKSYYNLSLLLAFLLWINAYMSIVNGFLSSVQNYFKNFLIVSLSQLLVYIFIILFVLILHQVIGVNSIAFGMLFSAFISYIVNRYYGNLFKKSQSYTKMDSFVVVQNIILIIISFFPFHSFASIAYLWAGQLDYEGGVSLLGYSHSFCAFLSVAASMGLSTVSFPDLARSLSSKNKEIVNQGFINFWKQIEAVVVFSTFVAVFTSVFACPIISVLFLRGEFDNEAVIGLSSVLPIYLVNGVLIAIMNLTRNVFYSLNKQKIFAVFSGLVIFIFFFSSIIFSIQVNYIFVGFVETISMGLFALISLFYINSLAKVFWFKDIVKLLSQIVLLILIAIFLYLFYKNILNYYLNNIVCLLISGVLYTVLADFLLCKILVNEMILSVNEKIAHVIKSKLF